jgi:MinD-like ATPase involved in chromosome partitioning or flagellar assembly
MATALELLTLQRLASDTVDTMSGPARGQDAFPRSAVLHAELKRHGDRYAATLELPDGSREDLTADSETDVRAQVLAAARRFLGQEGHQFGRLTVADPDRVWELVLPADDAQEPVVLGEAARISPGPAAPATGALNGHSAQPADDRDSLLAAADEVDRKALYSQRKGPLGRISERIDQLLKDQPEKREDEVDRELGRRWVVHDTNVIVVSSSKGGVAKTTNTIQLGTCLATSLPNQRVAAIDFNVGGGALGAAAAEDRQASHTMFELHRDRNQITRHSLLQPYVSSLPSGLDLLTVPPQPELALEITPDHYQQLFDELLIESYDILLLDTSPDIMNPVTRWALSSGSQLVISTEQGFMTGSVVQHALDYLLAQQAAGGGEQTIAVINKVINDVRAGSADETERALKSANPAMPVIRIPYDLDLRALIDSGHYDLQHVKRRATRLPIKELTLEVCRRLI